MIDRNGCARPGSSVRWEWGCATDTIHIINFGGSFSATSPTCGSGSAKATAARALNNISFIILLL